MWWCTKIDKYEVWPFGHNMAIFSWYLMLHKYIYRCSTIETLDFSTNVLLQFSRGASTADFAGLATALQQQVGGSRHLQDNFTFSLSGNNWMPDVQETIVNHGGHIKTRRGWSDIFYARLRQAFDRVGQTMSEKSCFGFWKVHIDISKQLERKNGTNDQQQNELNLAGDEARG